MSSASQAVLLVFERSVVVDFARSTAVTSQVLSAFFGYCGSVERIVFEHEARRAIVLFEKTDAAQTALLLDRGVVCGGEVRVSPIQVDRDVTLVKRLHVVLNESKAPDAAAAAAAAAVAIPAASSVFVSNVAAATEPSVLVDFFGFCGDVSNVRLFSDPSNAPHIVAVVTFGDAKALETALLLDGAQVHDRPISVARFTGQTQQNHEFTELKSLVHTPKPDGTNKTLAGTASARIKAMKDAGIDTGKHALARAHALDERFKVSERATGAVQTAKDGANKAKEIAQYGLRSLKERVSKK
jgi:RNA recognition motif-containing protein